MHHIKSDARREAWSDDRNPFARHRPQRNASNATRRAEEGLVKTKSTPSESKDGRDVGSSSMRPHHTDPSASSRNYGAGSGDADDKLEHVRSPDAFDLDEKSGQERTSDHTSTTEVAQFSRDISTTGYQNEGEGEKHKRFSMNKLNPFHKKSDVNHDDDNGKDKAGPHFTFWGQFRAVVLGSWVNVLLIFSPIGIAVHFAKANVYAIFVINFIAIIPLAGTLSYATEEIALRTGEVLGGLLNASFGNAVELIVSIIALFQNQFLIVQTSLIGSILSNLLLVLGMAFFFGGINRIEQAFNTTVAQTASSLLFLAVASLIIPTAFEAWANTGNSDQTSNDTTLVAGVPELSHATALILLVVYGAYLFFQLKSHVSMYTAPSQKNKSRFNENQKEHWKHKTGIRKVQAIAGRRPSASPPPQSPESPVDRIEEEEEDEPEQPMISMTVAIFTLVVSTVLVALNAEFLVDSINEVTCDSHAISKTFVGLILLPIAGNAAEHFTAVSVAIKDKMDLSIGVAVGSSMQIALLVLPFIVVLGWIAGKGQEMTLYFDGFQLAMLFVAVLLVNYLIQDGKSHWLEGLLLMMLYIIIAVAAWFYPTNAAASGCET